MSNKKIRLAILKELKKGNKNIGFEDLLTSEDNFVSQSKFLESEGLIRGVGYFWNPRVDYEEAQITLKGEQYLIDNSAVMKTYKGLKEIRDWLPFY